MKIYLVKLLFISLFLSCCGLNNTSKVYEKSCMYIDTYDYNKEVPQSAIVSQSYFNDVLIAGDSRVGSLDLYNELTNAEVAYVESLSLNMIDITKINKEDPDSVTLFQSIINSDKNKIYLMLGLNEMGWTNYDKWYSSYVNLINQIKEYHPDSYIFLILLYTPIKTYAVKKENIQNEVKKMNELIIDIAQKNYVYYLNPNDYLLGEEGFIKSEFTFDGIHFTKEGTKMFVKYLMNHPGGDMYVKEVCE